MRRIEVTLPGSDDDQTREAYSTLCANLQFSGADRKVICFACCGEKGESATVPLHTAKHLSELGKNVLFIDADLRKSVTAGGYASRGEQTGLSEVLTGTATIAESLYVTQYPNLKVLFAGKTPPNPVELLSGMYFAKLIGEARKIFDYIIIDTPPLGTVIDGAVIASRCDAAVMGLNCRTTRYPQLRKAISQLEKSGTQILGIVRCNSTQRKADYSK